MHQEEAQKEPEKQQPPRHHTSKDQIIPKYQLSHDAASLFGRVVRDGVRSSQNLPLKRILEVCEKELHRLSRVRASDPSLKAGMVDNELTVSLVGIQSRLILEERMENEERSNVSS